MTNASAVKAEMMKAGGLKEADIAYITDDLLAEMSKNAVEVPNLVRGVWTGNHFVANGTRWTWLDQIGNQCGQTRTWTYTCKNGDSYGVGGQCPQGYPWWNINVI